ncbi:WAPL domain containing protein [Trichuris trichiura]|uniref:WAPL domain containing protein n=1 Tax=Trichuris trichiura TaxID=36087 RepID=A0A077ZAP9_TRITR|nr:WAPL domain containing protein [Trichuris trichiura]
MLQRCVDSSFRVFLKARRFIDKIFLALTDSPSHDVLAMCCSCLFYIFARDRLSLIVNKSTLSLLVELIKQQSAERSLQYTECKEKIWKILCEWRAKVESNLSAKERIVFDLTEENIIGARVFCIAFCLPNQASLMALESLVYISCRNTSQFFMDEIRLSSAMFHFCMNRVVENKSRSNGSSANDDDPVALKFYSLLLTTFSSLFRFLCNLSNNNDLCCSKLSERSDFIQFCLECVTYTVPMFMNPGECYEFSVLFMSFLVNFIEHHHSGRRIVSNSKVRLLDEDENTFYFIIYLQLLLNNEEAVRTHTGKMRMKAIEQTVHVALLALVKADKHMEECVLASHAGLILGLLIQDEEVIFT